MSRVPAEQRREQLIDATIELAIREGLAAASVRRIADEANVSLGVVHYCFSSKEALLNAVAESFIKPIIAAVNEALEDHEGTFEEKAYVAFKAFSDHCQAQPGRQLLSYELAAWSIRGDGDSARLLYRTYQSAIEKMITEHLGITGSEGLPTRTLARMVLGICDGVMLSWLVDRDDEATFDVLQGFIAVLLAVIEQARGAGFLTVADSPAPA
ncbi:HTH-type transcriptional regulator BetI [Austwickia sp. TVS 96-490-7B]|uniref:TetR/AcrR family transcriptional regulator n=1 Tax=Austwickia sp. TVS 96-490-7B TaxID=2830843 RepID=UPI001C59031E|nr:TetR/AcrR family transcriptional regulator [Austwickia sp. TVS 96-490-7B]MBW3085679.1 HTH-type transcriptional regulator BetI [Austwickia sp. TVS 96-490-7B]